MKRSSYVLHFVLQLSLCRAATLATPAATFTTNTAIGINNTNFDGLDIVVTNATLTVDGKHAFASVRLLNGGRLTHSFSSNGLLEDVAMVSNELHVLSSTNPVALSSTNVLTNTIVVRDLSGNPFTAGTDYGVSNAVNTTLLTLPPGSAIPEGSTVSVNYEALLPPVVAGLQLTVSNNVEIEIGGSIDADGRGYGGGKGPGAGGAFPTNYPYSLRFGGGGGHGGYGAPMAEANQSSGSVNGSLTKPSELGSGGGGSTLAGGVTSNPGGAGGGRIDLTIGGVLRVDGRIMATGAPGTNFYSGGGSGGGILLSAQTFSGGGSITADGGAGESPDGGGGGGGRVGIYYGANLFSGWLSAHGGAGSSNGGAGTIFTMPTNAISGRVIIDNGGVRGANTLLDVSNRFDLVVTGGAMVKPRPDGGTISSLLVGTNGWIVATPGELMGLAVSGDAVIQAGGGIDWDGGGSFGGQGPGAGGSANSSPVGGILSGGGGGYGGIGGASAFGSRGGIYYGSAFQPTQLGSGGGSGSGSYSYNLGGAGGGALQFIVNGTLTLDGQITANGLNGNGQGSGGGSGGSLQLTIGRFRGAGTVAANGGAGEMPLGGGGGGGRIAIYVTGTNEFQGFLSARGGPGANNGSAGTIYSTAPSGVRPQMLVDNGGLMATNTVLVLQGAYDLRIGGKSVVTYLGGVFGPLGSLLIQSNSFLAFSNVIPSRIELNVNSNVTIQSGGGILLTGVGYSAGQGTGAGRLLSGGGGGYGGYGGNGAASAGGGNAYGLLLTPEDVGSGGGTISSSQLAGAGGGGLHLIVAGTLALDGNISADGNPALGPGCGGGSGGSVWLSARMLSGAGAISANGGSGGLPGGGGGGGGGRIAVYSNTNQFTGSISARGGAGGNFGGAGTIYFSSNNTNTAQLIVDNAGARGTNTLVAVPLNSQGFASLIVTNGATVFATSLGSLTNLFIATNSTLIYSNILQYRLSALRGVTIEAGGALLLDGMGNAQNQGLGAGRFLESQSGSSGSGAGNYGFGGDAASGAPGGNAFDQFADGFEIGSGGGGSGGSAGGAGGGAMQLYVSGIVKVDGSISANGLAGSGTGGGGSGGGIFISAGRFSGGGAICANGGSASLASGGGGGGGGGVLISYQVSSFTGTISARGGTGANNGGAGVVFLERSFLQPQLVVDNGGIRGTNTTLRFFSNSSALASLTVSGGATAFAPVLPSIGILVVASNSTLVCSNVFRTSVNIYESACIQSGGAVFLDGMGYQPGNAGPGRGSLGAGGGYGGFGGTGIQLGLIGGNTYGSLTNPIDFGSASLNPIGSTGTAGGGALQMTVGGNLTINGSVTANGAATSGSGGGGAGGSLWLTAGTLTGAGIISANGGAGNLHTGGGGGGGRIAVYYGTNQFTGSIMARGGPGLNYGGAGTIYLVKTNGGIPQVIVDNGGQRGTNTALSGSGFDLTVSGAAVLDAPVAPGVGWTVRNLLIASNSWITASNNQNLLLTVSSNASVQAGGGLAVAGQGNPPGRGVGFGGFTNTLAYGATGGGGGYGGYGGVSAVGATGGGSYGSILKPTDPGSGGGSTSNPLGGAGGGVLKLAVTGTLALDGTLSANGGNAPYEGGGGGSGGSIWLSAGTLSGAGTISADGGSGDFPQGGGGGGGRVAVYAASNQFAGKLTAYGGAGAFYGGAGTIYTREGNESAGNLLVDNGGIAGTNTPITSPEAFAVTIAGGAVVHPSPSPLLLGGLLVDSGGTLTHLSTQTNLEITVLGNVRVETNGAILVDSKGYNGANGGPGAGTVTNSSGSGGGYGGTGGASATGASRGGASGSATQPLDPGSRGGLSPAIPGFSQGGGAVLLRVSSNLTVNGSISANGNAAVIDGGGGGAGGSIWLTARQVDGSGLITANGGQGEDSGGGGGGGGRIAIYSRTNRYSGAISAAGGTGGVGAQPGGAGTVVIGSIPAPQVVSQVPFELVYSPVDHLDLTFSSLMNLNSVSAGDFSFDTPNGWLPQTSLQPVPTGMTGLRLNFPAQSSIGYYELTTGPQIEDIYGQAMAAPYIDWFVIWPPTISGRITYANGQPVPFVTLHPDGGLLPEVSDTNGDYSISVPPSWSGMITPARGASYFVPSSRSYTKVSANLSNQNFTLASQSELAISAAHQGSNLNLTWYGLNGVSYQIFVSPDLVSWTPYGAALVGTNGPMNLTLPIGIDPASFYRFQTGY